jgi:hypothetical protein
LVRSEVIGLGHISDTHVCPMEATAQQVCHLRQHLVGY